MQKRRNHWLTAVIMAGFIIAAAFPLVNLVQEQQSVKETWLWLSKVPDSKTRVVAPILKNKCLDCHSALTRFPFYADFPLARDIIQKDIDEARADFDLTDVMTGKKQLTDIELARLEKVISENSMPPLKYVALHWNARLTQGDKQQLLAWVKEIRSGYNRAAGNAPAFLGEPFRPLPLAISGVSPEKVKLGERLFHDKRLSSDNSLSCASCHDLKKGGTDQAPVSVGVNGQKGPINAPTVFNAAYGIRQFWDGRAADLFEQAPGPVHNPKEMGSNWKQVLAKLAKDSAYQRDFKRLYKNGLTGDNIADAIASFEKTLVTPNARFDRYLRGYKLALSSQEEKGYALFKTHCASCHVGPTLGGQSFEKMGAKIDYFAWRGQLTEADNGQFNFTKKPSDRYKFKVPTLRNIEVTGPYFHDAKATTLSDAVDLMAQYQTGHRLSRPDIEAVTAFLKALTGEYKGQPLTSLK